MIEVGERAGHGEVGKRQRAPDQEIALGVQAAPQMEAQYGGESTDARATAAVQQVGQRLVAANNLAQKTAYRYQFHLLADDPARKASSLAEVLGLQPVGNAVMVGAALVRFLPGGPQGRPQLEAELFL